MILGIFQRHYKIHRGASFIPFHSSAPLNLSAFIGNNGFGKSSILEGMDTFFNGREFNININEKKSEAFVAPLFLLSKEQIKKLNKANQQIVEVISNFLWTETENKSPQNYKPLKEFFKYRENSLEEYNDSHYLLLVTKQYDRDDSFFITFTNSIKKELKRVINIDYDRKKNNKLINDIKSIYSYIYIPVETSIEEFLKIETTGMQNLVNKKISDEIGSLLTTKKFERKSGRKSKLSLLDILNNDLEGYIDEVELRIKRIDEKYDFRKDSNTKKKLTANDLKYQIINSYLSNRTLRKEKKSIKTLSAGERKKALIDIAYALLEDNQKRDRHIILAIDEPESSLHISNCYDQFKRIEDMSQAKSCQVVITTHWYGSLPILNEGTLSHIELSEEGIPKHQRFSFRNYFEERRYHHNDIQLKSFYDLSSSIISSLRHYNSNWLIVEGSDDLNYITRFLITKKINILPVGGCSVVRMLYDFLYVPLAHNSETKGSIGKIMCLVDTDHSSSTIQNKSENDKKTLRFRRLQLIKGEVKLIRDERTEKIPLEVEEVMHPDDMYNALIKVANLEENTEIINFLNDCTVSKTCDYSIITGDNCMLEYEGKAKEFTTKKKELLEFINQNKEKISKEYSNLENLTKPEWIKEIEQYFSD
jgi:ABC-type cobalamin/Fe3+-siderophores transport system ATPase subunit